MILYMALWAVLVSLASLWAYRRSMLANVGLCLLLSIFQAAAALRVGSAYIMPAYLSLLFVMVRLVIEMRASGSGRYLVEALARNWAGMAFAAYCLLSAWVFPRLFAGDILVYPLVDVRYPVITLYPLGPTSQNVNQGFYILTSGLFAVLTSYAFLQRRSLEGAIPLVMATACLADGFATVQSVFAAAHIHVRPEFLYNNGGYLILDTQMMGGLRRLNGTFNEPSSLGAFLPGLAAFLLTIAVIEPRRRWAAVVGLWTLAMLVLSTSTTAYVGVAVCVAMVGLFAATYRRGAYVAHVAAATIAGLGALALATVVAMMFAPGVIDAAYGILDEALFGKLQSESAAERVKFAHRAAALFQESHYLGVGYGSFRASGGLQLIAGATGVVGLALIAAYLLAVAFARASPRQPVVSVAAKAGAITGIVTLFVSSSDLTLLPFWFFAGIAVVGGSPLLRPALPLRAPTPTDARSRRASVAARSEPLDHLRLDPATEHLP